MRSIACIIMLLLPCLLHAQQETADQLRAYFNLYEAPVKNVVDAFVNFEASARNSKIRSLDEALSVFQNAASRLVDATSNSKPIEADVWYLPALKQFGYDMVSIGKYDLPKFVQLWNSGASPGKLEDQFNIARYNFKTSREDAFWAQHKLIANKLYRKKGEVFCRASGILLAEARDHFKKLMANPVPGENGTYQLTELLPGALSGEIRTRNGDTTVNYVMYRTADKKDAYRAFNDLVYYLLSCNYSGVHLYPQDVLLDDVNMIKNKPSLEIRNAQTGISILLGFEMERQKDKNDWEWVIRIHYKIPYGF